MTNDQMTNTGKPFIGWSLVIGHFLLTSLLVAPSLADNKSDGKIKDLTFDDIKFEMKKGDPFERSMLTKQIEALDGQTIRIRGYMLPSFQQKGITQFVLVRDNLECCFGPGAALYDCVVVELKGTSATFTVKPIAVEGVFKIEEFTDPDGNHLAIYHLDGTKVK
jgi:hypothetical protein